MRISIAIEAMTGKFDTDLQRTARNASRRAKEMERSFSRLAGIIAGAFSVRALSRFTSEAIQSADSMLDMTKRIGGSVEALSELEHVANLSGVRFETMTMGLQRMTRRVAEAATGTGEAVAALEELNIEASDLVKLPLDQQFEVIADALSQVSNQSDKTRLAMKLFDSEGVALLQTMDNGAAVIRELRQEARELGKTLTTEQAEAAAAAADAMDRLKASVSSMARDSALVLTPAIQAIADGLSGELKESLNDSKGDVVDWGQVVADIIVFTADAAAGAVKTIGAGFASVGDTAGGALAQAVALLKGDFDEAGRIAEDWRGRQSEIFKDLAEDGNLTTFRDRLAEIREEQERMSGLHEIRITSSSRGIPAGLTDEVQKNLESQQKEIDSLWKHYVDAYATAEQEVAAEMAGFDTVAHMFPPEEQKRIREAIKQPLFDGLEEIVITSKKRISEVVKETSAFMEEASRNTQDIIADTLINGFDDGVRGILQSFSDMITQLVAQAIAADIAGKLFGTNGVGSGGGLIGGAFDFLGDLFGGGRATGGPVAAGMVYRVNENEPEFFRPDSGGDVIPLSKMPAGSGGVRVNQTIVVQGRPDSRTAQQMQIEAARQQRVSTARLG